MKHTFNISPSYIQNNLFVPSISLDNYEDYRYGFNGMEKDNEVKGSGNSYTTEWRQYDPRVGRWLSLDPMMAKFPHQSPYVAFDNNPIYYNDPKGGQSQGQGNPTKYQKSIQEGIQTLQENGLVFGGPADNIRTFNNDFFMITKSNQLRVKDNIQASDAITNIFKESNKYAVDCAEYIQILHLNAKLETMGVKKFNQLYNNKENPLIIGSHGTIKSKTLYTRDVGEKYWHTEEGSPIIASTGELLKSITIGSRLSITNKDTRSDDSFHNENFIYMGEKNDEGQPLFSAHPYGPGLTIKQIVEMSALHSLNDSLDANEFKKYTSENVQITEIEVYNEKK